MLNVHSLMTEQAGNDSLIPWILLGICAVAVVIALIVGYQKGFRRIGFGGLTVCAACGLYFVVERWLVGVNPINAIALPETLTPPVQALVHSAITAVACSIVSLIGFGVLSLLVRPSEGEMEKQVLIAPTEYGDEYDKVFSLENLGLVTETSIYRNSYNRLCLTTVIIKLREEISQFS